jgi:hypothetical protein
MGVHGGLFEQSSFDPGLAASEPDTQRGPQAPTVDRCVERDPGARDQPDAAIARGTLGSVRQHVEWHGI